MQLSSNADFSYAHWEPYSALKPWAPAGGDGAQTVYARFRGVAGHVPAPAAAAVTLDPARPRGPHLRALGGV